MSNLRIALVQEWADQAYFSGSTITGNLLLDVTEPKSYKYVSVQFVGRSRVYWEEHRTETSGNQQRQITYRYSSEQSFADQGLMLWTCQQSPDGKLAPAEYSWPFSFSIPPNAASSFEGTVGNIRYSLKGRIGTSLMKFDHNVEVEIPVQQLVSITDPRLLLPERQEVQKRLCCLCCASGPITLNASIPKTGFCVGESFPLHVSIENGSNRRITLNATISQRVVYTARGHQRTSGKTLICMASDPIEPQATREWDPMIEIPPTEILHESSCENIQILYSLVVTAKIPRALDLTTAIPLQLGNCSVQQQENQHQVPPTQPASSLQFRTQLTAYPAPGQQVVAHPASAPGPPGTPGQPGLAYTSPVISAAYPPQQPPGPNPTLTHGKPPPDSLDDFPEPSSDDEQIPLL